MNLADFLSRLQGVKKTASGHVARCPGHSPDKKPSLGIAFKDGRILIDCYAGCSFETVYRSMGLEAKDFFEDDGTYTRLNKSDVRRQAKDVAYAYRNESGQHLYENVRNPRSSGNKFIGFRHFDENGREVWGLNGQRRVPYNLPGIIQSESDTLFGCEGEKDADSVNALNFTATNFKAWRPEFNQYISRFHVIVIRDHDAVGVKQAKDFADKIRPHVQSVKIIDPFEGEPLPENHGKDVSDWIFLRRAEGMEVEEIAERLALLDEAAEIETEAEPSTDEAGSHDELQPVSIGSMVANHPHLRAPVIEGLLRKGEVANLIAKSKVGKSWLVYYVALSVACGMKLFGEFQCYPGRVLLIDNELHPETLAHRLPEVAAALGLRLEDYRDLIDVIALRGRLRNIDQMILTIDTLKDRYSLIIFDALYRMLPAGVAENSNEGLAQVYNKIDQYAAMTGAAIGLVHHATKGGQGEKDVIDVGSGAGAQSRAADTHIVIRPHQEEGCAVMEAVVRSWKPPDPLPLRWEFPLWKRADDLDAYALRWRKPRHEERKQADDAKGMDDIFNLLWQKPDTVKGLTSRVGMGPARIKRLVGSLVYSGRIESESVRKRGQDCELFRPVSTRIGD